MRARSTECGAKKHMAAGSLCKHLCMKDVSNIDMRSGISAKETCRRTSVQDVRCMTPGEGYLEKDTWRRIPREGYPKKDTWRRIPGGGTPWQPGSVAAATRPAGQPQGPGEVLKGMETERRTTSGAACTCAGRTEATGQGHNPALTHSPAQTPQQEHRVHTEHNTQRNSTARKAARQTMHTTRTRQRDRQK